MFVLSHSTTELFGHNQSAGYLIRPESLNRSFLLSVKCQKSRYNQTETSIYSHNKYWWHKTPQCKLPSMYNREALWHRVSRKYRRGDDDRDVRQDEPVRDTPLDCANPHREEEDGNKEDDGQDEATEDGWEDKGGYLERIPGRDVWTEYPEADGLDEDAVRRSCAGEPADCERTEL